MRLVGEPRVQAEPFAVQIAIRHRAQTRLAEAGLPLNLEVNSKQVYWPFTGDKQFQADDIKLKLTGKMTDYTLSMRTAVKGQDIPPATITLRSRMRRGRSNASCSVPVPSACASGQKTGCR